MKRLALAFTLPAWTIPACAGHEAPARAQWSVVVATDVPVPQFGDTLLLEVLAPDGAPASCDGCRRVVDASRIASWPMSFGIVPPAGGTSRIRARLYRTSIVGRDALPVGDRLVDATGELPAASGITRVALQLRMDCFGIGADPKGARTCDPALHALAAEPTLPLVAASDVLPMPGSWGAGADAPCTREAPGGMTCVPGGAFLLGSTHDIPVAGLRAIPEQLVQLSPFFLDDDELTIHQIRPLVRAGQVSAPNAYAAGSTHTDHCTWRGEDTSVADVLPVNCVSYTIARATCSALGKRLPTEAEWEYAAGNRGLESTYPWGETASSLETCKRAVIGRGRLLDIDPNDPEPAGNLEDDTCLAFGVPAGGPLAGGAREDVSVLGIRNLGGNLVEWVADRFIPYGTGCWIGSASPLVDPRCDDPAGMFAVRGGGWVAMPFQARAYNRSATRSDGWSRDIGFRCAQSI